MLLKIQSLTRTLRWRLVVKVYCMFLCFTAISIGIITIFVVVFGHHFFCFDTECKPLSHALTQFQEIAPMQSHTDSTLKSSISTVPSIHILSSIPCIENIDPSLISLSLMIGQRRGGTSWMRHVLMTNSQIVDLEEILRIWYNDNCSQFAFLLDGKSLCTASSMLNAITLAFREGIESYYCLNPIGSTADSTRMVFIGKIQIEQIAGDFMESLVEYIVLNEMKILHLQRGAVIASFLSYSMDEIERISNFKNQGDFDDLVERSRSNAKNQKLSQFAIELTPSLALDYVQKIEGKHQEFKRMIARNTGMMGYYLEVYYESLMDSTNSNQMVYLKMIESFLDIDSQIRFSNVTVYKREHPLPCYQKIKNWKEIQQSLQSVGSISEIACKNRHS